MPEDEIPTGSDEMDERQDERPDEDDDVAGHAFVSRTRPHEQAGAAPGVSGAIDPDVDVRS